MEAAYYEDGRSYAQPSTTNKDEVRKRLTLDLNTPRLKKPRFDVLLSSPDLNMLKLPSPELEKLIMQQNGLLSATPTPGGFVYPLATPSSVAETRQAPPPDPYGREFDVALAGLHNQANQMHTSQHLLLESNSSNSYGRPPSSVSPFSNSSHVSALPSLSHTSTFSLISLSLNLDAHQRGA